MKQAIAVDIGGTKIRAGLVDEDGQIFNVKDIPTESKCGGEHVLSRTQTLINDLMTDRVSGIGIGTAGQINLEGKVLSATDTFPNWAGIALQERVEQHYNCTVRVVNDVQAMALGEMYFGEGKGVQDFLCLAIGTGVGGAIVSQGKLIRGSNGSAGEIGHMVIQTGGRKCPCGKQGCLEAYVSGTALATRYEERFRVKKSGRGIIEDVSQGNSFATVLLKEYVDDLVTGISSLTAIFNPSKVILGGGVAESLVPYLDEINSKVHSQLSQASARNFSIVHSQLNGEGMLLGAASLILK
jgi:glucokinase